MFTTHLSCAPIRRGNAIVLALGVIALVSALLATSASSGVANHQMVSQRARQLEALAAVEAVLARREGIVLTKASDGSLLTWTGSASDDANFGRDIFGECEVRWKIEPARSIRREDVGGTGDINWVSNPSPDTGYTPLAPEQTNEYVYLYRIAAEARMPQSGNAPPARAQGVRFVAINEEPLFRYVIFYAQQGPKGDLEFSHEEDVVIQGSVHSNGAIYLGSKSLVNNWGAMNGPSGRTQLGPVAWRDSNEDGNVDAGETNIPVRVNGVDGIFRLSKPLIFGALNRYPIVGQPGAWSMSSSYEVDSSLSYPRDDVTGTDATALAEATDIGADDVRFMNPYRVLDGSGLITRGTSYQSSGGVEKNARVINDRTGALVPILGEDTGGSAANDARDGALQGQNGAWRGNSLGPSSNAPAGFDGMARTNETGGRVKPLPKDLTGVEDFPLRPLEPQALRYIDADGDASTDQHELAMPLFVNGGPSGSDPTESYTNSSNKIVEVPGKYLQLAIGDSHYLARRTDGSGWDVVDGTGAAAPAPGSNDQFGLIIRERQVADTSIWPGAAQVTAISSSNPAYMPYAYGKHFRPASWPFSITDVTDGIYPNAQSSTWARWGLGGSATLDTINASNSPMRAHSYEEGGTIRLIAANDPGKNYPAGYQDNNLANGYRRYPYFYNENWRFVNLKRPAIGAQTATGLSQKYFKDSSPKDEGAANYYQNNSDDWFCLLGDPDWSGVAAVVDNVLPGPSSNPTGVSNRSDRFSVRWEGFVVPEYDESYDFIIDRLDDGGRLYVDGNLISPVDEWKNQGPHEVVCSTSGPLTAGQAYHIVLEFYENGGGEDVELEWRSASCNREIIPTGTTTGNRVGLYQMAEEPGFDLADVRAFQAKINTATLTGPNDQKVGLMIRHSGAGWSAALNGRDRYVAICYSPTRGFFTQRRMEPAKPTPVDVASFNWYIGEGSFDRTSPTVVTGGVSDSVGQVNTPDTRSGTSTYNSTAYTFTNYTRTATVSKYDQDLDQLFNAASTSYYKKDKDVVTDQSVSVKQGTYYGGDGKARNVKYGYTGGNTATKVWKPKISARKQSRRRAYLEIDQGSSVPGFVTADDGRRIRFYNKNSTTTTTSVQWDFDAIEDVISSERIRMDYYSWGSWSTTYGSNTSPSNVSANANYVYINSSTSINGKTGAQIVNDMKEVNAFGRSDWVMAPSSVYGRLSGTTITAPNPSLSYTGIPDPVPADAGYNGRWSDSNSRSFAIDRGTNTNTIMHDVNSYVSSTGTWFSPNVDQLKPWNTAWNGYAVISTTQTGSFRPNAWQGPLAPTFGDSDVNIVGTPRWADDEPSPGLALPALGSEIWLRIERDTVNPNGVKLRYYQGADPAPAATLFTTMKDAGGADLVVDITGWDNFFMGPCVQSGDKNTATSVAFEKVEITLNAAGADSTDVNNDGFVNKTDWDALGTTPGALTSSRYLASQYQVFWGPYDITEDFFSYLESDAEGRTADEDWIYSPREFWSQNRLWDHGTEKDGVDVVYAGHDVTTNRQLWSKTTLLSLNMGVNDGIDRDLGRAGVQQGGLQGYLRDRLLSEAVQKRMTPGTAPTIATDYRLSSRFNGLFYAARTNRYPYNPNRSTSFISGRNPWSFNLGSPYPNTFTGVGTPDGTMLSSASMGATNMSVNGIHRLQPYVLEEAPAIKPQDFHHGVRVWNASDIYWGYSGTGAKFGQSKTSIVTPNQLYVHGDVNTVTHSVTTPQSPTTPRSKFTPLAMFGDAVHLLSNNWVLDRWQNAGLTVDASGNYTAGTGGILQNPIQYPASNTSYVTCFLTHNRPTTRETVREGQAAAFIDTMMFMEDWAGRRMDYTGSLVVMDSRRYTRAFLLDSAKTYGRTVFGRTISTNLTTSEQTGWTSIHGSAQWTRQTPMAYQAPARTYSFNDDLLTEEGTPPFTPFGLSVSGVGGWSTIVK